jgi:5-oxoprolinase (ATP-hydrolysing) subunit A
VITVAYDINCDLGEGFGQWRLGDDDALLDLVTSANVACGFHAGDPSIMRRTCDRAVRNGVRIGAHIGYRDLVGFGRRALALTATELRDESLYQIGALDAIAKAAGGTVTYVKPHGALYHSASIDFDMAQAIVAAAIAYNPDLAIMGPAESSLHRAALDAGATFNSEGFADRAYLSTGSLAPRSNASALLGVEAAVEQALALATTGTVETSDGGTVEVRADSICIHGDSPNCVEILERIRTCLRENQIPIEAPR